MHRPLLAGLFVILTFAALAPGLDTPLPPDRAAARMSLPKGFRATLVAGEPKLIKPIALGTDNRGRLWVVESHSYPRWITDGKPGRDRILIFEDKGNGRYESKVFCDKGTNLSGIAIGFGGVWLCSLPRLLFVPVRPGTDKPAGPPVVVLDGWDLKAQHNVFNSLTWGPDGWLYGCNGILSNSHVGAPGTPAAKRVPFNCGVWRYHPAQKRFEPVAWGTTNPWGLDFDDYGEMFITNCVIKHLFHVIPGAHFQRMYGQDLNPHCYGLMESCADHIHWGGGDWTTSRGGQGAHNKPGGGHAHAGALVYLGDNWPKKYRNRIFMCNIHGNRLNQDVLERRGSGYVAHHGKDFLMANDPWFRGLILKAAADGGIFVADWHDTGECHNYDKVHPSGRVYKITYGKPAAKGVDLTKLSDEELVRLQLHKNDWLVRHARRLLQERAHTGKLAKTVRPRLLQMLGEQAEMTRKLRALWALHVVGGADEKVLTGLLKSPEEVLRGWAVRLLMEERRVSKAVAGKFAVLAKKDTSAVVRLALASALQRLPLLQRWAVAEGLAGHEKDAAEPNLPLMIWYGIEPAVPAGVGRAAGLISKARIPLVRRYIARRIALMPENGPKQTPRKTELSPRATLVRLLAGSEDAGVQRDVLRGMYDALQGRRDLSAPRGWSSVYRKLAASPDHEVRDKVQVLSVLFGDKQALAALRKTAADARAKAADRTRALQTLVEVKASDLLPLLQKLLTDRKMRGPALRGLAAFSDPKIPSLILSRYAAFNEAEKADAVNTLASRPKFALALLDAMEKGKVARRDLSPFTARQLLGFKDKQLTSRLNKVWGTIRQTAADRARLLVRYKALATPAALKKADRKNGRAIFARTCANCHTLFGAGGKIGPDLTGSQRTNPEYILTKVLDPNAVVSQDYQVTRVTTAGGRVISGIVKQETDKTLTLQTPTEVVRLSKGDIDQRQRLPLSMMPEGQLAEFSDAEVCDLLAYFAGPGQVPLPRKQKAEGRRQKAEGRKNVQSSFPGSAWERTGGRLRLPEGPAACPAAPSGGGASRRCVPRQSLGTREILPSAFCLLPSAFFPKRGGG
jgi:putative membrane-bound dehydrogenase-like protein